MPVLQHSRRRTYANALRRQLARLQPGARELPSYFIVGAKRAGTTSLHDYITRHPDVLAPLVNKGCRYFDVNYDKGWSWFERNFPPASVADRREQATGRRPIVGESSPYYAFHHAAPERIHEHFPQARILFLLREPVARAWSHYNYEVAKGHEPLAIHDALDREAARLAGTDPDVADVEFAHRHYGYIARSCYAGQVLRLYRLFGHAQVLLLPSELLFSQPQAAMDRVFAHLGLAPFTGDFSDALKSNRYDVIPDDVRERLAAALAGPTADLRSLTGVDFWA